MKKILLDTNAYSSLLRGDETILEIISNAASVYMSVFVIAELLAGFKLGTREKWNRDLLNSFILKPSIITIDATTETAEIFSEVFSTLKKSGNPIPINDIWIASHAIETGSVLITNDRHFQLIPGLRIRS